MVQGTIELKNQKTYYSNIPNGNTWELNGATFIPMPRITKKSIIYGILEDWHDSGRRHKSGVGNFDLNELEEEVKKTLVCYGRNITGESCARYCRFLNEDYALGNVAFGCQNVGNGIFEFVEYREG